MNNPIDQNTLMAYLYGELNDQEKFAVEQFLANNPEAKAEFEQLSGLRRIINDVAPVEVPAMDSNTVLPVRERQINWRWWGGVAAALALLLLIWNQTEVEFSERGIALRFGAPALTLPENPQEYQAVLSEVEDLRLELLALKAKALRFDRTDLSEVQQRLSRLEQMPRMTRSSVEKFTQTFYQNQIPKIVAALQNNQQDNSEEYTELLNEIILQLQEQRQADLQAIASQLIQIQNEVQNYQQETEQTLEVILTNSNAIDD